MVGWLVRWVYFLYLRRDKVHNDMVKDGMWGEDGLVS